MNEPTDDVPVHVQPPFVLKSLCAMLGSIALPFLLVFLLQFVTVWAIGGAIAGALAIRAIVRRVNRRDDPRFVRLPGDCDAGSAS